MGWWLCLWHNNSYSSRIEGLQNANNLNKPPRNREESQLCTVNEKLLYTEKEEKKKVDLQILKEVGAHNY